MVLFEVWINIYLFWEYLLSLFWQSASSFGGILLHNWIIFAFKWCDCGYF